MAKKTIYTCDHCGKEFDAWESGHAGTAEIRITKEGHLYYINRDVDLCSKCANDFTKIIKTFLNEDKGFSFFKDKG